MVGLAGMVDINDAWMGWTEETMALSSLKASLANDGLLVAWTKH